MQILLWLYFLQILDFLVTDLEGGFSPKVKYRHQQDVLPWHYSRDNEVSFLMSCSFKVTQYMDQTTSQLYSTGCLFPRFCTGR